MKKVNPLIPYICILAGGPGTRLKDLNRNKSKCLMRAWANEKWVFIDLICYPLVKSGFNKFDLVICPSEGRGEQVEGYISSNWQKGKPNLIFSKINLIWTKEPELKGTGRAIYQSIYENHPNDQDIIMTPVDTFLPGKQVREALRHHRKAGATVTLLVSSKSEDHTQNRGRILVDKSNNLIKYSLEGSEIDVDTFIKENNLTKLERMSSGGMAIISPKQFIRLFDEYLRLSTINGIVKEKIDFYRDLLPWLSTRRQSQIKSKINYFDINTTVLDLGIADNLIGWREKMPKSKFIEWVENNK